MTTGTLIDNLTYACYRHNRHLCPGISPERWKIIFTNVDAMEERYQDEEEMLDVPDDAWYENIGHGLSSGRPHMPEVV